MEPKGSIKAKTLLVMNMLFWQFSTRYPRSSGIVMVVSVVVCEAYAGLKALKSIIGKYAVRN